jgi:predicted nucleic acid-binding protein
MVLVDTCVWSESLRRKKGDRKIINELKRLVERGEVAIIGPIRQELLSSISDLGQYERLKEHLRAFTDLFLHRDDYELAAFFGNSCRRKGIQGAAADFLICAVAERRQMSIFTTDKDFSRYSRIIPIKLWDY